MILLMGIAGAGKGTQAKILADRHGYRLMTMGDMIRTHVSGEQRERMLNGDLLDDQEVIDIVDDVLKGIPSGEEIVLDGFPRTIPQAEWLFNQAAADRFDMKGAFHLQASREAVKERLLGRARVDDVDSVIEKRFDEYERATKPLLTWLSDHGVKVVGIDAERSVEAVAEEIENHLKQVL